MFRRKSRTPGRYYRRLFFESVEERLVLAQVDVFGVVTSDLAVTCDAASSCLGEGESSTQAGDLGHDARPPCSPSNACGPTVVLDGVLPRQVKIIDTSTSRPLYEAVVTSRELPIGFLPAGNYVLLHNAANEIAQSLAIARTSSGAASMTTNLTFEGEIPRRVRFLEAQTGQSVWDHWIYGSSLDIVGLFPAGDYIDEHSAPGEAWQTGSLRIGVNLPSYRLYAELRPGQSVFVDWGTTGTHATVRVNITHEELSIVNLEASGDRMEIGAAAPYVHIEVTAPGLASQAMSIGELPTGPLQVALPGVLPRHVKIFDTTSGLEVFAGDVSNRELDVGFLDPGHYLLSHGAQGEVVSTFSLAIDGTSVATNSTLLNFAGTFPRLLRVTDARTGQSVWNHWIYGPSLDVVGLFPAGDYIIEHSASGQPWQSGQLRIGANLPSYRLYAEHSPGQSIFVDWGTLGDLDSIHLHISENDQVVVDAAQTSTSVRINSTAVNAEIKVTASGHPVESLRFGDTLPVDQIKLTGVLPRSVAVIDTVTGQPVYSREVMVRELDLSFLADGHYILFHGATNEVPKTLSIARGHEGMRIGETSIPLEGALPRRVRITNSDSGQVVWDYWHYGSTLNVVGLLPEGSYVLQHSASGGSWRTGELHIGAHVPSYRLYTEHRESETVYVDWGTLGYYENVRVRALLDGVTLHDQVETGTSATFADANGKIDWQIIPGTIAAPPLTVRTVTLSGIFPRQVRIVDVMTNAAILDVIHDQPELDISFLGPGHYLLQHGASGEFPKSMAVAISASEFATSDPSLTFPGPLPRRVRFVDRATSEVKWDHWIYGATLNVHSLLPAGTYQVEHSSSGESWKKGVLQVGASIPSYRLYVEQIASDSIRIDWGNLGLLPGIELELLADGSPVIKAEQHDSEVTLRVPQGLLTFNISVDNVSTSLSHCSLPALAPDGSCRNVDASIYASLVMDSLFGFSLDSPWGNEGETPFSITEAPKNGVLEQGTNARIQTYRPNPGYVGRDTFVYQNVAPDGTAHTSIVTLDVLSPVNPTRSYFVPGYGTIDLDYRTPGPASFIGTSLPYPVVVNSDFAMVIERYNTDGSLVWRHTQPFPGRSVAVVGTEVVTYAYNEVRLLDAATGKLNRAFSLGLAATEVIHFVSPIDEQRMMISWFDSQDNSYLGIWSLATAAWEWQSTQTYLWPRWAEVSGDLVVVADTYGHRIVGESLSTREIVFEVAAFFPNEARFVNVSDNALDSAAQQIMIVEEHANRIWLYDWVLEEATLVIAAPGQLEDLSLPFDVVVEIADSKDMKIDPSSPTSKSKASIEFSGIQTVYSPNGAVALPDGSYYVADTDNHRVIHVSATGEVLAQLTGFNSPTKITAVL